MPVRKFFFCKQPQLARQVQQLILFSGDHCLGILGSKYIGVESNPGQYKKKCKSLMCVWIRMDLAGTQNGHQDGNRNPPCNVDISFQVSCYKRDLKSRHSSNGIHCTSHVGTANPTWGDIFESSKLKAITSLLPRFSGKRPSSFELRALKQHSKMSPQVGLAVHTWHR